MKCNTAHATVLYIGNVQTTAGRKENGCVNVEERSNSPKWRDFENLKGCANIEILTKRNSGDNGPRTGRKLRKGTQTERARIRKNGDIDGVGAKDAGGKKEEQEKWSEIHFAGKVTLVGSGGG